MVLDIIKYVLSGDVHVMHGAMQCGCIALVVLYLVICN